jgi:hypothetical protein
VNNGAVRELPIAGPNVLREDRTYFINPGSVDAARKREHKLAEFACFDSSTLEIEFQHIAYDDRESEAKALAGGYRIGPWTDRLYTARRRLLGFPHALSRMRARLEARRE